MFCLDQLRRRKQHPRPERIRLPATRASGSMAMPSDGRFFFFDRNRRAGARNRNPERRVNGSGNSAGRILPGGFESIDSVNRNLAARHLIFSRMSINQSLKLRAKLVEGPLHQRRETVRIRQKCVSSRPSRMRTATEDCCDRQTHFKRGPPSPPARRSSRFRGSFLLRRLPDELDSPPCCAALEATNRPSRPAPKFFPCPAVVSAEKTHHPALNQKLLSFEKTKPCPIRLDVPWLSSRRLGRSELS